MIQSIESMVPKDFPKAKLFSVPLLTMLNHGRIDKLQPIEKVAGEFGLFGYIAKGGWYVNCPFCKKSQAIAITDPWFHCAVPECLNGGAATGLMWKARQITLPSHEDMMGIELALLLRPSLKTRNWVSTETVQDLRDENKAHNVPETHMAAVADMIAARWEAMEARA